MAWLDATIESFFFFFLFLSLLTPTVKKSKLKSRKFRSSLLEMWFELQSVLSFNHLLSSGFVKERIQSFNIEQEKQN